MKSCDKIGATLIDPRGEKTIGNLEDELSEPHISSCPTARTNLVQHQHKICALKVPMSPWPHRQFLCVSVSACFGLWRWRVTSNAQSWEFNVDDETVWRLENSSRRESPERCHIWFFTFANNFDTIRMGRRCGKGGLEVPGSGQRQPARDAEARPHRTQNFGWFVANSSLMKQPQQKACQLIVAATWSPEQLVLKELFGLIG